VKIALLSYSAKPRGGVVELGVSEAEEQRQRFKPFPGRTYRRREAGSGCRRRQGRGWDREWLPGRVRGVELVLESPQLAVVEVAQRGGVAAP
jgi:hypothetical protein